MSSTIVERALVVHVKRFGSVSLPPTVRTPVSQFGWKIKRPNFVVRFVWRWKSASPAKPLRRKWMVCGFSRSFVFNSPVLRTIAVARDGTGNSTTTTTTTTTIPTTSTAATWFQPIYLFTRAYLFTFVYPTATHRHQQVEEKQRHNFTWLEPR